MNSNNNNNSNLTYPNDKFNKVNHTSKSNNYHNNNQFNNNKLSFHK